jgi:phage baseplate assembly protein W
VSYPELPHFAYPFQRTPDGSGIVVNEQDTEEDIMACEMVIVSYPVGFRDDRPEFGWAFPEMAQAPLSSAALAQALKEFEPRAPVRIDEVYDTAMSTATFNTYVQIQSDSEES